MADCDFGRNGPADRAENFRFADHTTFGVGGECGSVFFPKTEEEAFSIFSELNKKGEKIFVLGRGSNVLASDSGFTGHVICTSELKGIFHTRNKLICLGGTKVSEVLAYCIKNGLSGLEFLAGIPASVGGVTYMNACACGKSVSDVLVSCTVFDRKIRNFSNKICNFGYKYSTMRDINCIITATEFKLCRSTSETVAKNIAEFLGRRADQPKGKSCGCVFKNPSGIPAGKLIDDCGLKGFKINGAEISPKHANFIINRGGSAGDIYRLIQWVKKTVREKTGISLEEEVVYIGEFDETFS